MMKNAQMSMIDLMTSFGIISIFILLLISFGAIFAEKNMKEADKLLISRSLENNLEENNMFNGRRVDFMDDFKLNMTRLSDFGNISNQNLAAFEEYFFGGMDVDYIYDICFFALNQTKGYEQISPGRIAYGKVSNSSEYDENLLVECQYLMYEGLNPCHFYEDSLTIVKPVFHGDEYLMLYFLLCQTS